MRRRIIQWLERTRPIRIEFCVTEQERPAIVTSLLKGEARTDSLKHGALTAARYLFACVAGCIALDYLLGFIVQSAITGIALPIVAVASMGFVAGDAVKAVIASAVVAGLAKLK